MAEGIRWRKFSQGSHHTAVYSVSSNTLKCSKYHPILRKWREDTHERWFLQLIHRVSCSTRTRKQGEEGYTKYKHLFASKNFAEPGEMIKNPVSC